MSTAVWVGVVLATMKHHVTELLPETSLKWSLVGNQQFIKN